MADYYLVETARGPAWDDARPRRKQEGWDAHAAFMNGLVDSGFVVMGGPVGEIEGDRALVVVEAASEAEVRDRLAGDPWAGGVLSIQSVRLWTIWMDRDEEGSS